MLRYADNLSVVSKSVSEGLQALQAADEILTESGFNLKHEDGQPQDIRDPQYDAVRTRTGKLPAPRGTPLVEIGAAEAGWLLSGHCGAGDRKLKQRRGTALRAGELNPKYA